MSNATVSSQVYIVRNADALAAVSTGTMIIYADGTDLYAKDAAGNVYSLTHPSASNLSVALNNLTDVTISSVTDNQILQYNTSTSQWENVDLAAATTLGSLTNVASGADNSGTLVAGQALLWSGSQWEAGNINGDISEVVAGAGLTGGASSGSATIDIGAGTGITVNANDIQTNDSEINHDDLLNFVANEHINHANVSITAGTGLSGGGDITASRTIDLADTTVTAGVYTSANITVDAQGRITAAANGTSGGGTAAGGVNQVQAGDGSGNFVVPTSDANGLAIYDFTATKGVKLNMTGYKTSASTAHVVTLRTPVTLSDSDYTLILPDGLAGAERQNRAVTILGSTDTGNTKQMLITRNELPGNTIRFNASSRFTYKRISSNGAGFPLATSTTVSNEVYGEDTVPDTLEFRFWHPGTSHDSILSVSEGSFLSSSTATPYGILVRFRGIGSSPSQITSFDYSFVLKTSVNETSLGSPVTGTFTYSSAPIDDLTNGVAGTNNNGYGKALVVPLASAAALTNNHSGIDKQHGIYLQLTLTNVVAGGDAINYPSIHSAYLTLESHE